MNQARTNNQQKHALSRWYLDRGLPYPTPKKTIATSATAVSVPQVCLLAYTGPLNSDESVLLKKMIAAISLKQGDFFAIDLNTDEGLDLLRSIELKESSTNHLSGVVFGKIAARKILGEHYSSNEPTPGSWFNGTSIPWIPLLHTFQLSDLIENPSLKRPAWNHLQELQKKIRPE